MEPERHPQKRSVRKKTARQSSGDATSQSEISPVATKKRSSKQKRLTPSPDSEAGTKTKKRSRPKECVASSRVSSSKPTRSTKKKTIKKSKPVSPPIEPYFILNPKEKQLLQELRLKLDEYDEPFVKELEQHPSKTLKTWLSSNREDEDLCRFLKANKWKVEDAWTQYSKALDFRRSFNGGVDIMLDSPDPLEMMFQSLGPHLFHGHDKEGRPVYYERTGHIDVGALLKHAEPHDLVVRHVRRHETQRQRMLENSRKFKKSITQHCIIMDISGMSMSLHPTGLKVFRETLSIDSTYYPERLAHLFIINAPWLFQPVWTMIRKMLDPVTANKIHVLGAKEYQDVLREYIDPDQLLKEYGGEADSASLPFVKEFQKS